MNISWEEVLQILKGLLKPGTFKVWIEPLHAELSDQTLRLKAPSAFVASWVQDRYLEQIKTAASQVLGFEPKIRLETQPRAQDTTSLPPAQGSSPTPDQDLEHCQLGLPVDYCLAPSKRYWRHCFDDFVIGSSNRLAHAACSSLCQNTLPAEIVFLASGPGLGKTHLLHSVGNYYAAKAKNRPIRVGYITAEEFTNQMIMALKNRNISDFKEKYRNNFDILLLEDVHFFQGKEKIQEELLATVKCLEQNGSKVVLTSSFLPKELDKVDNQLMSVFCSGFIAPIESPEAELRRKIVQAKAEVFQVHIPSSIQEMVCENIHSDIRQLESCIKNLALKARLFDKKIDRELAEEVLRHFQEQPGSAANIKTIIYLVSKNFEIPEDRLCSRSQKRKMVTARNTAYYLARKYTNLSLKEIGNHFNRRHSTVLKGITNLEREIQHNTQIGGQAQRLEQRLQN